MTAQATNQITQKLIDQVSNTNCHVEELPHGLWWNLHIDGDVVTVDYYTDEDMFYVVDFTYQEMLSAWLARNL